jgi:hypothetical protein
MPVIGDTPCSRVTDTHMRRRGHDPPVMLGAQIVQPTELQIVGEWPGSCQRCIPLAFCLCHSLSWTIWSGGQIVAITTKVGKNLVPQHEVLPCTSLTLHNIPPLNLPRLPIFWITPGYCWSTLRIVLDDLKSDKSHPCCRYSVSG